MIIHSWTKSRIVEDDEIIGMVAFESAIFLFLCYIAKGPQGHAHNYGDPMIYLPKVIELIVYMGLMVWMVPDD